MFELYRLNMIFIHKINCTVSVQHTIFDCTFCMIHEGNGCKLHEKLIIRLRNFKRRKIAPNCSKMLVLKPLLFVTPIDC